MFEIVNSVVLFLLAVSTLLPILRIRHWSVRAFDFPRLQIFLALLGLAVCAYLQIWFGISMSWLWWLILVLLVINHIWWIWPYSILHVKQVPDHIDGAEKQVGCKGATVSILSCNVLMTNRQSQPLIDMIKHHKPDLIALLETDEWWQQQIDKLSEYPNRVACPLDNKYGMHLYSKLPLTDTLINYLVEDDVPSISAQVELTSSDKFHFQVIHPRPPAPGENDSSTARDVELLVLAQALEPVEQPIVVTGDLNDVAWSRTTRLFRRVSRLLDPRTGRGMFNTFNANYWFARWPLDHVFVSTHFRVCKIQRLEHMGSDHFPMLVKLSMTAPNLIDEPAKLNDEEHELLENTLQTNLAKRANQPYIPNEQ